MSSRSLDGRTVVVIGASAGIGRAFALRAASEGARVLAAARRPERLEEIRSTAPDSVSVVTCDVTTDGGIDALRGAAEALGQIDLIVNAVGVAPMTLIADATPADWHATFATNVVGVHRSIQVCLPLLSPTGLVAVLSSESVGQARPALGVYAATKAAVDQLLEVWRAEEPDVRFSRIIVGSTIDTEFGAHFPGELLGWALQDWLARGLVPEGYLLSEDVADMLAGTLATALSQPTVSLDTLSVRPTGRVAGTPAAFVAGALPQDA